MFPSGKRVNDAISDDLDAARTEAIASVRELMQDMWHKKSPVGRQFELTNEAGEVLLVVPFTDANYAR